MTLFQKEEKQFSWQRLKSYAEEREVNLDDLVVVFADGCNKMGGFKHGFTAEFERLLGRPVLHIHFPCHSLEEMSGHIFVKYAGPTTGSKSWSREEAKKLVGSIWDLPESGSLTGNFLAVPVADFEAVQNPTLRLLLDSIPPEVLNDDMRYCCKKLLSCV